MPPPAVDALAQLIGCDRLGAAEVDGTGYCVRGFDLPEFDYADGAQACDGGLPTGIVHLAASKDCSPGDYPDTTDTLRSSFSTSMGTVVQVYLDRPKGRVRRERGRPAHHDRAGSRSPAPCSAGEGCAGEADGL